ncbi:MAG TPA: macro domain-containing protein [Smithellaceae bacterium]|nr:MAG: RNase III inhibitor [Deltaproteobacteria bacterium ADurb.Bin135]HPL66621.1 macro domain-containing protein [Smithellaceae bacterium]
MIVITDGNILKNEAEALVNTVNCVGFMGKGIALQFKKAYPDNYVAYKKACNAGELKPGRMFIFKTGSMINPKYIINFPTKRHWKGNSHLEDIREGLKALVSDVRTHGIQSIAVPPLGCGLGGLPWHVVRPIIEKAFHELPNVKVLLFEPHGAPDAKTMPVHTKKPKLTIARALFIKLMEKYGQFAYRLTLLEMQKLAYFLQEAGEPLKLKYDAGIYGPYAPNLNKVLEVLEGHYTRGYGDTQKPDVEIDLLPNAIDEANKFLAEHGSRAALLIRVADLIEGFETPYGMELLSSVHWVANRDPFPANSAEEAVGKIHAWSDRKRNMFRHKHIEVAWNRLREQGWLSN